MTMLVRARGALLAVALLAALSLAGCGPATPGDVPLSARASLKIGYLASLTGFCATLSRQYVQGARLAASELNGRGGVLGHRVEVLVRDDRASPAVGVAQARDLVLGEGVKYLAGTCSSAVGRNVAQLVANPSHVLYAVGVSDPSAFAGGPRIYAFDTIPTTTVEGQSAAAYVRAHPRWRRIALIAEGYAYGHRLTAAFERALASAGRRIVGVAYLPSGGGDYAPYIRGLLARHPDAIYSTAIAQDAQTLVRDGLPLGLFEPARNLFGTMDYATIDAMPRPPVGVEGYTLYPSASIYHTPFARELRRLGAVVADGGAAGEGFNQVQLIAQGIEQAGSTDPAKVRDALGGARVQMVQGPVRVPRCDHQLAVPIATGTVVGPTAAVPSAHFQPLRLASTEGYAQC